MPLLTGNLGSAFFSKGNYREALTNHRNQLVLAMKLKDREARQACLFVLPDIERHLNSPVKRGTMHQDETNA
ncbi:Tetratricopeptide repeat protein 28 [Collichthys lucidus]|uniref:Tetratricopeptide repeat protein 28 n=1 Tax=Collichthys lucidus TaxID=240159 RepID=A0A4U5UUQ4_COLLU|nr:Tetratricopeptide repeat protein 28 [Collichthys lucidus]